jgi:hypothetical protein
VLTAALRAAHAPGAGLFPLAELLLSGMEEEIVADEFPRIEGLGPGPEEHERYRALARQVARTAPTASQDPRLAA